MKVFEIKLKVYLLQDIMFENIQSEISSFIDGALGKNAELKKFHERNEFKNYCFDGLYPIEKNKVYSSDNIYTITLRTINKDLADFFVNKLVNEYSKTIKGLTCEIRIIPKKIIEKIYSITPVIMKDKNGYWKGNLSLQEYEKRIIENLIKKYNYFMNSKINENFQLYDSISFKNKKPIPSNYKNVTLLGDKISLNISQEALAQEIAYMSLGTGVLEMNARGYGFVNYRWL